LRLVDARHDRMSRASINVWLFVIVLIMTGIEI
jgi:hypothetical protein